jgi:hypothetical protein
MEYLSEHTAVLRMKPQVLRATLCRTSAVEKWPLIPSLSCLHSIHAGGSSPEVSSTQRRVPVARSHSDGSCPGNCRPLSHPEFVPYVHIHTCIGATRRGENSDLGAYVRKLFLEGEHHASWQNARLNSVEFAARASIRGVTTSVSP